MITESLEVDELIEFLSGLLKASDPLPATKKREEGIGGGTILRARRGGGEAAPDAGECAFGLL
jgi:hypothetical protein